MLITLLALGCSTAPSIPPLDIRAALSRACEDEDAVWVGPEAERLAVFEGPSPELAVNVVLFEHELVVDGERLNVDDLAERLAEKAETARDLAARTGSAEFAFRGEILLQVGATMPGREIVPILQAAAGAGFHDVQFVGRSATPRPEVEWADPVFAAELSKVDDQPIEVRQRAYADATEGVLESCPPLMDRLEASRKAHEAGCDVAIAALEESLPQCPDADARRIVTLFQRFRPHDATIRLTTLSTRLDPDAPAFEVRPDEPWADVVSRLKDAGPRTWWRLAPAEAEPTGSRSP